MWVFSNELLSFCKETLLAVRLGLRHLYTCIWRALTVLRILICNVKHPSLGKSTRKCSSPRVIREIKAKPTISSRLLKMKKHKIPSTGWNDHWNTHCWLTGTPCGASTVDAWQYLPTLSTRRTDDPAVPFLVTVHWQTSPRTFITALFKTAPNCKLPKCPSAVERINTFCGVFTNEKIYSPEGDHPHQNAITWTSLKQYWARAARLRYRKDTNRKASPREESG